MKIYFIILVFFIVRMILAQKKKARQAQIEASKLKIAEQKIRSGRTSTSPLPTFTPTPTKRTITPTSFDSGVNSEAYEANNSGYGDGYSTQEDTNTEAPYVYMGRQEDQLTGSEHDAVSHFLKNTGLSDMDRKQEAAEEEQAYSAKQVKGKQFVTKENFRQFIIAKEIFDRPKAMKR